jgi:hypothetical protein
LAALYHQRWEIETALDELKTHLRDARVVPRSKTPDLVRQEFYGLLMAHFAIRGLMHEAALKADEDPDDFGILVSQCCARNPPQNGCIRCYPPLRREGPFRCATRFFRNVSSLQATAATFAGKRKLRNFRIHPRHTSPLLALNIRNAIRILK